MKTLTIVTPSYNQGCYIAESLESVRNQKYPQVEHLVLDGGSTDNTVDHLRSLDDSPDWKHLRWQSGRDGGQSDALNRGFLLASGDIIGWLNSDDRYRPHCFEAVMRAFAEHPEVDVFYGDYTFMDEGGTVRKVRREIEFNPFILMYHRVLYIPTTSTFFRRRIFEEGNLLREDLHYAMDYEFFLRLSAAGYRIRRIPQIMADFRFHPQSKTCSMVDKQSAEKRLIMEASSRLTGTIRSTRLRACAFFTLQIVAGLLRWSEKLFRGAYFIQHNPRFIEKYDAHPDRS
jgi:glycosyltransferase involved in cell wall biosynthesis